MHFVGRKAMGLFSCGKLSVFMNITPQKKENYKFVQIQKNFKWKT